jgi:hypothetical protein
VGVLARGSRLSTPTALSITWRHEGVTLGIAGNVGVSRSVTLWLGGVGWRRGFRIKMGQILGRGKGWRRGFRIKNQLIEARTARVSVVGRDPDPAPPPFLTYVSEDRLLHVPAFTVRGTANSAGRRLAGVHGGLDWTQLNSAPGWSRAEGRWGYCAYCAYCALRTHVVAFFLFPLQRRTRPLGFGLRPWALGPWILLDIGYSIYRTR